MGNKKILYWFTTKNGTHIPVTEGESKEEALNRFFKGKGDPRGDSVEELKEKQKKEIKEAIPLKVKSVPEPEKRGKDSENIENITPEKFVEVLRKAKDTNPPESRWRVTVYDADHYRDCKLYVSEGGSCVAVKPNGDIISLCKNQNDTEIYGRELLDKALNNGGDRLDAFGKNLYRFYTKNGFTPISWTPFNKEYAPDDWKEEYGEEPVVFYKYTGKSTQGNYKDFLNRVLPNHDYDEAMEQRDKEVRK